MTKSTVERGNIEFSGRLGSGHCCIRCKICGQLAKWPADQIIHAEQCPEGEAEAEARRKTQLKRGSGE